MSRTTNLETLAANIAAAVAMSHGEARTRAIFDTVCHYNAVAASRFSSGTPLPWEGFLAEIGTTEEVTYQVTQILLGDINHLSNLLYFYIGEQDYIGEQGVTAEEIGVGVPWKSILDLVRQIRSDLGAYPG